MKKKNEDAPVNSTGPAVPGTGSDVAHWKKKKKKKVSDVTKKYKNKKDSTWDSTWESVEVPVDVPVKAPVIEPDTTFRGTFLWDSYNTKIFQLNKPVLDITKADVSKAIEKYSQ